MSNAILVNPFPYGADTTQHSLTITGSIALCGAAVATGEPLNWGTIYGGVGYNEINNPAIGSMITGGTAHGPSTALVTTFAASGGTVTATAANNFFAGQNVYFVGNTSTLGLLLNGTSAVIVTASATQFTFLSTATGTGTGEVGLAVTGNPGRLSVPGGPLLTATVTALSASGTTLTVTAANTFLPGAQVTVSVATGTLGPKLTMVLPVLQSTGTAFTALMPSALTGTTGTGTATGANPPMPYDVRMESALQSGYIYQYNQTFGTLFVDAQTNAAAAGDPLAKLAAAAYPAGVLNDVVRYTAKFAR